MNTNNNNKRMSRNFLLGIIFIIAFSAGFGIINAQQQTRNIQNKQDIFTLVQENKAPSLLTASGKSQHGTNTSINKLRLSPKDQKDTTDTGSLSPDQGDGLFHIIGSTIIDKITVYQNSRFYKGLFVGINNAQTINGSNASLQVNGAITIKELADPNRANLVPVCTGPDGVIRLCVVDPVLPPSGTISWQEPTKRCENGKVISTWYVTGNEGRLVQFRRSQNDAWLDATIGVNGIEIEVPKEEETVGAEDRFCKTLYYRVPDLPNKNKNDVTNGIWGCVDTFNKQECPDN